MSKHTSKPYNPSIANVFCLTGLIENWGRGVEKICQACKEDESPLPEYTVHPGDIMIQFTAAEGRAIHSVTKKVSEKVTEIVSEKEIAVLELLEEDPAYISAVLADKLGVSRKTISLRLKSLKKGVIRRIGSDTKVFLPTCPLTMHKWCDIIIVSFY